VCVRHRAVRRDLAAEPPLNEDLSDRADERLNAAVLCVMGTAQLLAPGTAPGRSGDQSVFAAPRIVNPEGSSFASPS
jgi:hypothetical protein